MQQLLQKRTKVTNLNSKLGSQGTKLHVCVFLKDILRKISEDQLKDCFCSVSIDKINLHV